MQNYDPHSMNYDKGWQQWLHRKAIAGELWFYVIKYTFSCIFLAYSMKTENASVTTCSHASSLSVYQTLIALSVSHFSGYSYTKRTHYLAISTQIIFSQAYTRQRLSSCRKLQVSKIYSF